MQVNRRALASGTLSVMATLPVMRASSQATPEASPVISEREQRVLAVLEQYGVPGAAVAVRWPGSEAAEVLVFGVADLEKQAPMTADMHFRIASITKTFVATVVLQLIDEGALSFEDTIADLLPNLSVANASVVTVRNLLQMRSGLPQYSDNPAYEQGIKADTESEVSIDYLFDLVSDLPARFEPDSMFEYNNLNYDILGEIVHTITGASWDENVQSRICQPLGLANTMMANTPDMPVPFARGYGYLDQPLPDMSDIQPAATPISDIATPVMSGTPVNSSGAYDLTAFNPTIAGAAGGLISTVQDQIEWARALATGELLSPDMYSEQVNAIPMEDGAGIGYGMGVINIDGLIGHNGGIDGYQSVILSAPDMGLDMAVLTNANPTLGFVDAAFEIAAVMLFG